MTKIRIVPDNDPGAEGEWIEAKPLIDAHEGDFTWVERLHLLHAQEIPRGFHAVQYETIGGTRLSLTIEPIPEDLGKPPEAT